MSGHPPDRTVLLPRMGHKPPCNNSMLGIAHYRMRTHGKTRLARTCCSCPRLCRQGHQNPSLPTEMSCSSSHTQQGTGFVCLWGTLEAGPTLWTSQTREGQMVGTLYSSHKLNYGSAMDTGMFYPVCNQTAGTCTPAHWLDPLPRLSVFLLLAKLIPGVNRQHLRPLIPILFSKVVPRFSAAALWTHFSGSTITKPTQLRKYVKPSSNSSEYGTESLALCVKTQWDPCWKGLLVSKSFPIIIHVAERIPWPQHNRMKPAACHWEWMHSWPVNTM